ncbi:hypothetical protein [Streptomyces hawaiiensis]|uniref:DUF4760 domain-containing protein n=1 Tax=Streptomyces hawaiiensis TaxID=67305 RepID=A0A6G5RD02_9ACTN|nr:hypothetical protein [Streptomyces hawaiiensis]QCD55978.1 hypothetical protein CEB94_14725 [Streptomyces hawaiiensis]
MSPSTSALVIAFVGIIGTLASALLTQRSANNNKLREIERADQQRREERAYETEQATIEIRRACYVALNIAARLYQTALTNYLVAIRSGAVTDEIRTDVDEMRRDHRARHAEAQMLVPDAVLVAAGTVNSHLSNLYGILRRIDIGEPEQGETVELAAEMRRGTWENLSEMRTVMRRDLGIGP